MAYIAGSREKQRTLRRFKTFQHSNRPSPHLWSCSALRVRKSPS